MIKSKDTLAVPPGATIREQLEIRKIKQKEFALRMGLSEKHISRLINGQVELTQDVALRLENVLGVPASFWNNLECIYREKLIRVEAELDLERDVELAAAFPYARMAALGWVPASRKAEEKALNLRRFFEVAKLDLLLSLRIPGIVYRRTGTNAVSDYSLAAWAQEARLEARQLKMAPIQIPKIIEAIPAIREMTTKDPAEFCKHLTALLAGCGVAVVFLPHLSGSFLHGASFYDGRHIVMGLTVRGKDADRFWFSLFHELGHIVQGHIGSMETSQEQEDEADSFAENILIPAKDYDAFIAADCFSKDSIVAFAASIGIAPGIVLGRLQKDNILPYDRFNDLKVKYGIAC